MGEAFSWGAWTSLGFPPVQLADAEKLAAAKNLDGHLEVFAVGTDGAVWHKWQTSPNGAWFPQWASFGQPAGVSFASPPQGAIHVEQNADGRLEVFVKGDDGNIWHIWQVVPNANWIDHWTSLGQPSGLLAPGFNQALVRNEADELEVFFNDDDTGDIWSIWQEEPNGIWTPNWNSLGTPPGQPSTPAIRYYNVIRSGAGPSYWLEAIAIGSDGVIWHNVRPFGPTSFWTGWSVIADPPPGVRLETIEALRKNQDSRLELTCGADNRDYWHTWQTAPDPDSWSGIWDNFGQPPGGTQLGFDMQLDALGQLEGFTWGEDFFLYRIRQSAPNDGWVTWGAISNDINIFGASVLVAGQNQDGRLDVFTHGSSGSIYHISQQR